MTEFDVMRSLTLQGTTKILLLVLDGLGGLPMQTDGRTELEAANTPNLGRMASEGTLGTIIPIMRGVTPGSGVAHLALFGYDPIEHAMGRGVLEASGIGLHVGEEDVAARGNFCTVDSRGRITDRRAGRIASDTGESLVDMLQTVTVPGVEIDVRHVREYRFVVVMRGGGLLADLEDTDPQVLDIPPLAVTARTPAAQRTADLFNQWIATAGTMIADENPANMFTLRGFSSDPRLPKYSDVYKLRAACVADYPMYRGVARLVGMDIIAPSRGVQQDWFASLAASWNDHDFFFVHVKATDSFGEDGDFAGKVRVIEGVDEVIPDLLELGPDVVMVTGDHSTPAKLGSHSWHPVPILLWAPGRHLPDYCESFGERECARGGLGIFKAKYLMPLAMAHAGRMAKFGA